MGLKGYRLWVMGQLDSNVQSPTTKRKSTHTNARIPAPQNDPLFIHRSVALQVAFERQTLKPVFHLIGFRLWV
jgi:hypothetical protein